MSSEISIEDRYTRRPSSIVGKRRTYITVPAFEYTDLVWLGASEFIAQIQFSASRLFVIPKLPELGNNNFQLCIRYRIGADVFRYKLWNHPEAELPVGLYTVNNFIQPNFVLELWTVNNTETFISLDEAFNIFTSINEVATSLRDAGDLELAAGEIYTNYPAGLTFPLDFDANIAWLDNEV